MDSPQLLHLALLLLALAAPRPNIATSIASPAEGTEDFSTVVNFFRCKQCNSCICTPDAIDFEKYRMIADGQNKASSDVSIKLMTSKTHTTVCFEEENSCLNETYGIYWERDGRPGLACGSLSSGENGRGDISTEKRAVCCEAETGTNKRNPELKCFYTEMSHPKLNAPLDAIRGEGIPGNPEFLTSKKNNIGILFAFLFVGVGAGWGTMYYCLRLRRRGQAFRQCRQDSEGDGVPLHREASTREETPLSAPSSSLSECTTTS